MLLDEPFSALDTGLRRSMHELLAEVRGGPRPHHRDGDARPGRGRAGRPGRRARRGHGSSSSTPSRRSTRRRRPSRSPGSWAASTSCPAALGRELHHSGLGSFALPRAAQVEGPAVLLVRQERLALGPDDARPHHSRAGSCDCVSPARVRSRWSSSTGPRAGTSGWTVETRPGTVSPAGRPGGCAPCPAPRTSGSSPTTRADGSARHGEPVGDGRRPDTPRLQSNDAAAFASPEPGHRASSRGRPGRLRHRDGQRRRPLAPAASRTGAPRRTWTSRRTRSAVTPSRARACPGSRQCCGSGPRGARPAAVRSVASPRSSRSTATA